MSSRAFPGWLAGLALLFAACQSPPPRIPFQRGNWHAMAVASGRASSDRYHEEYGAGKVEVFTLSPGTHGWGWDISVSKGSASGDDPIRITNPPPTPPPSPTFTPSPTAVVDNHRDTEIYELSVGARQTFLPDSTLQPYVGVGTSFFKTKNSDHYTGFDDAVDQNGDPLPIDQRKHFQTCSLGLWASTGVAWSVLRDRVRKDTEFVIDIGLRYVLADEFSFAELSLGFGFGR